MVLTVTLFEEKIRIPFQGIKGYTIEHVNTIDIENPDILIHQSLLQQEEEDNRTDLCDRESPALNFVSCG